MANACRLTLGLLSQDLEATREQLAAQADRLVSTEAALQAAEGARLELERQLDREGDRSVQLAAERDRLAAEHGNLVAERDRLAAEVAELAAALEKIRARAERAEKDAADAWQQAEQARGPTCALDERSSPTLPADVPSAVFFPAQPACWSHRHCCWLGPCRCRTLCCVPSGYSDSSGGAGRRHRWRRAGHGVSRQTGPPPWRRKRGSGCQDIR